MNPVEPTPSGPGAPDSSPTPSGPGAPDGPRMPDGPETPPPPTDEPPSTDPNRPGLPEISYRAGVHAEFRARMLGALEHAGRSRPRLTTRDPDDPTIALIDAWAAACDVLTFYTERLANESYLRTATEHTSLRELGALVAYRLVPGVAAETHLAFTVERPPPPVAGQPADPGLLPPPPPASVALPPGLRVQSVPGPGEVPQTFETVEKVEARPEWNALPLCATREHPPVRGRRDAWFAGAALGLKPGDALLFAGTDLVHDRWDLRRAVAVAPDRAGDRTHVRWDRPLGSAVPPNDPAAAPDAFVLRRRLPVFGHNAPRWSAMNVTFRETYAGVGPGQPTGPEWPGFTALTASGDTVTVDLDGSHPEVVPGSWVVVSQEGDPGSFYRELYEVRGCAEVSRAEFGVSGTVTRLRLRGEAHSFGTPREVTVFAVAEPLTVVEAPDDTRVATAELLVDGDAGALPPGRRLVLRGPLTDGTPQGEVVEVAAVHRRSAHRTLVVLTAPPTRPYPREGTVLLGNVARATHGESVRQVLGDGDARRTFQTMPLLHGPLTHVRADTPQGAASTLTVRVDDVAWQEADSLFGATPQDRLFTTRVEPDGRLVAVFGDGVHGARLPTGSHNVRASYRKGVGAVGNLDAGQLSQLLDRPLGVKAVSNPVPASGGADPQTEDHARASMPLPTRTLGRVVSLRDYADFALAHAGVSRAEASVLPLRGGRTVVVSVCGPEGSPAPATTVGHLTAALLRHGDPRTGVRVLPARQPRFRLALRVRVADGHDAAVVAQRVRAALRAVYAPGARRLAEPVHRSQVVAVAASVPGVAAVDLDRFYRADASASHRGRPPARSLVAAPAGVDATGNPTAAELLALADDPFDWLQELT